MGPEAAGRGVFLPSTTLKLGHIRCDTDWLWQSGGCRTWRKKNGHPAAVVGARALLAVANAKISSRTTQYIF